MKRFCCHKFDQLWFETEKHLGFDVSLLNVQALFKDPQHSIESCAMNENVVKSLLASSRPLYKVSSHSIKTGWMDYVGQFHAEARRAFKAWVDSGKRRHALLFAHKKGEKCKF